MLKKFTLTGNAEAGKILAIGKSNAESYKLSVEAMGGDNFTQLKVMESIAAQNVKIMPDVLIGNSEGGNGGISGLLGLQILQQLGKKVTMVMVSMGIRKNRFKFQLVTLLAHVKRWATDKHEFNALKHLNGAGYF